jgi:shikimate dehydrogenase
MITAKTTVCMVIGDPVEHSLSPTIHNAGYRAAELSDQFIYVASRVDPANIEAFANGMRAMNIRGASCTMPHKEIIMPYLDEIDEIAKKIGAVNTVVQENGILKGYNTDWLGTVTPLKAVTDLRGKNVAILGAGGASKAMAYGLVNEGAIVTAYNRTLSKAEAIAREFGCKAATLDDTESLQSADIICNATSVGMGETTGQSPIDVSWLSNKQIVFDAIYSPYETALLKGAAKCGARVIHGTEMLLHQALPQFKLYTGVDAPVTAMRQALMQSVGQKELSRAK